MPLSKISCGHSSANLELTTPEPSMIESMKLALALPSRSAQFDITALAEAVGDSTAASMNGRYSTDRAPPVAYLLLYALKLGYRKDVRDPVYARNGTILNFLTSETEPEKFRIPDIAEDLVHSRLFSGPGSFEQIFTKAGYIPEREDEHTPAMWTDDSNTSNT
ncbi:hypothetical protein B0T26DRAFT_676097 [Lasiosphaeria miniovina]|uniref:Uncharacterized protein n=1 Tax=Lasiosphaeria miniovina TaxID=1954250 RepID=A0AA40ALC4_9PEZI|nr:uncharacterized protein B0T26DRAFT_676097 [Lasiosphaeria miniovina]KAK0717852.1 hypothetical protein B0T26DRAFT_676097 [Lasiosphaeria miniovina]